jgi:hypothetical protein
MKVELTADEIADIFTSVYAMRANWRNVPEVNARLEALENKFDSLVDHAKEELRRVDLLNQLNDLIDRFDFDKVSKTMAALDWDWFDGRPTVSRMKDTVAQIGDVAIDEYMKYNEDTFVATGGFKVSIRKGKMLVEFITSSAETF